MPDASRLGHVVETFDELWQQGPPPDIRQVFAAAVDRHPEFSHADARGRLLTTLIRHDLEFRWRRWSGEEESFGGTRIEDYRSWFDDLKAPTAIPIELIEAEFKARTSWGDEPTIEDYLARFPGTRRLRERLDAAARKVQESGAKLPDLGEDYKAIHKCNRGAFGIVYKARQLRTGRAVAVKVLDEIWAGDAKALKDFRRELRSLRDIEHPHVIPLYDARLLKSKRCFLVFRFAGGGSLRERMKRPLARGKEGRAPDPSEQDSIARLMWKISLGVAAAHALGVIHRDLKPENILFDARDEPLIADFGAARMSDEAMSTHGAALGTRPYMAPEQFAGVRNSSERSDIYSLGVIFFELLTGRLPFPATLLMEDARDLTLDAPSPRRHDPAVDPELAILCCKCLEKRPANRIASASELAAELDRFLQGQPITTPGLSRPERLRRLGRRHRVKLLLGATLGIVVTISGLLIDDAENRASGAEDKSKSLSKTLSATTNKVSAAEEAAEAAQSSAARSDAAAKAAEQQKRLEAYGADMELIEKAWRGGDTGQVRLLLNRHIPANDGDESIDPRGFEWYYWDRLLQTGSIVLATDHRQVRDIDVDPSGRYLAAADFDSVSVWDLKSQKKHRQWNINTRRKSRFVAGDSSVAADDSVAFSPDGKYVAATGFVLLPPEGWVRIGSLKVWEVTSGTNVLTVGDEFLGGRAVTFSPDGKSVIGGGIWSGWRSWNLDNGQRGTEAINMESGEADYQSIDDIIREQRAIRSLDSGPGLVRTLRFTPENDRLESGDFEGSQVAWIWPDGTLANGHISQARISPGVSLSLPFDDQDRILSLDDGVLCLKRDEGSSFRRPGSRGVERTDLSWSPRVECFDYRRGFLVVGDVNHAVSVWRANDGQIAGAPLIVHRGHGAGLTCVKATDEGLVTSADAAGFIRKWSEESPEHVDFGKLGCVRLVMDEDQRILAIVDVTGNVAARLAKLEDEELDGARISPNEQFVVIGWHGTGRQRRFRLMIWDLQNQREVLARDYDEFWLRDETIAISADSTALALGGAGDAVAVLSLATGQELFRQRTGKPYQLAFDPAGRRLAVGGMTSVAIWDVSSGEKLGESAAWRMREGKTPEFWFSADGQALFVDGEATAVWTAPSGERSAPDVSADAKMPQDGPRRLYRLWPSRIEIYCAQTHRRLLSVPFKVAGRSLSLNQDILIALKPVPGADGLMASVTLDRLLDGVLAQWNGASAERRDTPAVEAAGR